MPTLGPLWSGCTARVKAVTAAASKGNSYGPSSTHATGSMGGSPFSRLEDGHTGSNTSKNNSMGGDVYKLDRLYVTTRPDSMTYPHIKPKEDGSLSGSETALSPEHEPASAIKVSTRWTVTSERA